MSEWTEADIRTDAAKESLTGYAIYDALGVRFGYVSGWISDGNERVQMLKIRVTEWSEPTEYLVPIGAITLIDDDKAGIQLRDLTKDSIRRRCYQLTGRLPERRLLVSLNRHFPPPRPSVLERLARISSATTSRDGLTWRRLSDLSPRS